VNPRRSGLVYHPRPDDEGQPVAIERPTAPSPRETWQDPRAVAVFTPDGPVPPVLNGVRLTPARPPSSLAGWTTLVEPARPANAPPPFPKTWKKSAAGAVIVEPDGRVRGSLDGAGPWPPRQYLARWAMRLPHSSQAPACGPGEKP
jgi:hypothetical protein